MFHEHGNKMGVPDMRKNMKTLVAEIFFEDKYSAIHKCECFYKVLNVLCFVLKLKCKMESHYRGTMIKHLANKF